jgi:hypothetical protein
MPAHALSPVSALDAIRNEARAAVDAPESERPAALDRLRDALDAYEGLLKATALALADGRTCGATGTTEGGWQGRCCLPLGHEGRCLDVGID